MMNHRLILMGLMTVALTLGLSINGRAIAQSNDSSSQSFNIASCLPSDFVIDDSEEPSHQQRSS